jgi:hypothetical protein
MKALTKLFILIAITAVMWSCQENENETFTLKTSSGYVIDVDADFADGETTLTFEIDQSGDGVQNVSHMLFQFTDCYGVFLTSDNVVSATVNDQDWTGEDKLFTSTGTDCRFESGAFIKLDGFDALGEEVTIVKVVIVLDEKVDFMDYKIKSGRGTCFSFYELTELCDTECWDDETAWSAGKRYNNRGSWATYTDINTQTGEIDIFAGQNIPAGKVTFTVDGDQFIIEIVLNDEFKQLLDYKGESVKIQGYIDEPTRGNPSPGSFTTYKGDELKVELELEDVKYFRYYGVHLDLLHKVDCPEI